MSKLTSKQQRAALLYGGIAFVVADFVAVSVYTNVVVGVGSAIGVAGLLLNLLSRIEARPELSVSFFESGKPVERLEPPRATYPALDVTAIRTAETKEAMSSLPAPPRPSGSYLTTARIAPHLDPTYVTPKRRAAYEAEVETFREDLTEYLTIYDRERHTRALQVQADLRLENTGEGAATNVRLRLFFEASAFAELPEEDPGLPRRPKTPRFTNNRFRGLDFDALDIRPITLAQHLTKPQRGGLRGPTYGHEGPHLVVEYVMPHLSAGLGDRSGYPIELQARVACEHEVLYHVYADGLRQPTKGTLRLRVEEPEVASPAITRYSDLPDLDDG